MTMKMIVFILLCILGVMSTGIAEAADRHRHGRQYHRAPHHGHYMSHRHHPAPHHPRHMAHGPHHAPQHGHNRHMR